MGFFTRTVQHVRGEGPGFGTAARVVWFEQGDLEADTLLSTAVAALRSTGPGGPGA